jgi:hypothetical protein
MKTPVNYKERYLAVQTQLDQCQQQLNDMQLELAYRNDQLGLALAGFIEICELTSDWRKRGMQETVESLLRTVNSCGALMEAASRGEMMPMNAECSPSEWYAGVLRGYLDAELLKQAEAKAEAPPT